MFDGRNCGDGGGGGGGRVGRVQSKAQLSFSSHREPPRSEREKRENVCFIFHDMIEGLEYVGVDCVGVGVTSAHKKKKKETGIVSISSRVISLLYNLRLVVSYRYRYRPIFIWIT